MAAASQIGIEVVSVAAGADNFAADAGIVAVDTVENDDAERTTVLSAAAAAAAAGVAAAALAMAAEQRTDCDRNSAYRCFVGHVEGSKVAEVFAELRIHSDKSGVYHVSRVVFVAN